MKYGIDEVLKLEQDSLKENISRASFDKILIDSDSVKYLCFKWGMSLHTKKKKILVETLSI